MLNSKKTIFSKTALLCGFVVFWVAQDALAVSKLPIIDHARAEGLTPHKALYDIRLSSKKSGTQVSNISGQMLYEWQADCDAWISNTQFNLTYDYIEAPSMRITSDFSTYEAFNGARLDFTAQRKRDSEVFEEFRGVATVEGKEGKSLASYSVPQGLEQELSDATLFPIAHTLGVVRAIKEGKKFYSATIFDGSDEEGASLVNTFIGKSVDVTTYTKSLTKGNEALIGKKAWNLRLAFFPLKNEDEAAADYEMGVVFHDTGLISHMTVDYGDFAVEQKLVALEPMENVCDLEHKKSEKAKDKKSNPE